MWKLGIVAFVLVLGGCVADEDNEWCKAHGYGAYQLPKSGRNFCVDAEHRMYLPPVKEKADGQ